MTQGQRFLLGFAVCVAISLSLWALIVAAIAQPMARSVRVTVQFDSAQNVESLCEMISEGRLRNVSACGNTTTIIAPDPCSYRGRYAEIMCHEITCHVTTGRGDHSAEGCRA